MSTAARRTRARALQEADDFRRLIVPERTCERWEFAGSLRRQRPDVADIEVVAIAAFGEMPAQASMFGEMERVNLLWRRVEDLVALGTFAKHVYGTTRGDQFRWGEKYRGIEFRGCNYEIFLAVPDNWGAILAIRTGPDELSKDMVFRMRKYGYRQRDGFVWDTKSTPERMIPVPTEESFFAKTGIRFVPPEQR